MELTNRPTEIEIAEAMDGTSRVFGQGHSIPNVIRRLAFAIDVLEGEILALKKAADGSDGCPKATEG